MTDPEILKKHGGTDEELKSKFESKSKPTQLQDFILQCAGRIRDGASQNLRDSRLWWAVDRAYDIAQRQCTYTLAEGILSRGLSSENVLNAVKDWGLDNMISDMVQGGKVCTDASGNVVKTLDIPTFFNVYVPLVSAYHKIRWAKLTNDRDLFPRYKYEPAKLTMANSLKCEIITDRIQRMTTQMGYREDDRQLISQTLMYGTCLSFPMEDWYVEKQLAKPEGKEEEIVVREGLRFSMPHPSRFFYDSTQRISTFNTDTGCSWAGYWDVVRFGDVQSNDAYWNREDVGWGKDAWVGGQIFSRASILYPCALKFPDFGMAGVGAGDQDRINRAFTYTSADKDQAVTLAPFFVKENPKKIGLFDYDYPIWMRLVFAGEDTVVHARPLGYSPIIASVYDADMNRGYHTSLGLELLPWQDLIGNYLTQQLLSVKQNLSKCVFYNTDVVDEKYIKELQNLGEKKYKTIPFLPYSAKELSFGKEAIQNAFQSVAFPQHNTQEIAGTIQMMITIMERMLGFSAQELGGAASHEQSATEVNITKTNIGVRLEFTGGFIDDAINAKKRMLYDAMMAYSTDEVFAEVADMNDVKKKQLETMGFKVEENEDGTRSKAGVKGSKKGLVLDGFSSSREGFNRIPDAKIATAMLQSFQTLFAAPPILEAIGIKQLIELYNQMLFYAGLPKDWRLRIDSQLPVGQQQAQAQQQQQAQMQQLQMLIAATAKPIVDAGLTEMGQAIQEKVVIPQMAQIEEVKKTLIALAQQQAQTAKVDGAQDAALTQVIVALRNLTGTQPVEPVEPTPMTQPAPAPEQVAQ